MRDAVARPDRDDAMPIHKLDHVNLRTTQLDPMIAWYTDVLGLQSGYRPEFEFPGAWLYADDSVVVHLIGVDSEPGVGSEAELKLEHFAFAATDLAAFEARLQAAGETYRRGQVAALGLVQMNVRDPDGNHIHVDFEEQ